MRKKIINEKPSIIIWGNDGYNSLGVLRQLSELDYPVLFLVHQKKKHCATWSKYCKDYVICKTVKDGINFLKSRKSNLNVQEILIPTNDVIAEVIDSNKEDLRSYLFGGVGPDFSLAEISDKVNMCKLAKSCGFKVPKTVIVNKRLDISSLDFPCVIKPRKHYLGFDSKFKIRRCENTEDLINVLTKIDYSDNYIIQEAINKVSDILIYGCRLPDHTILIPGVFKKLRWDESNDGSYGYLMPFKYDNNYKAIRLFLESINYVGLFSFEFGECEDILYFYEANLRNDGTSHYFYQSGSNVIAAFCLSMFKKDYLSVYKKIQQEHVFIDEIRDSYNISRGNVEKTIWKTQRKKATVFKYYSKDDKKPYAYMFYRFRIISNIASFLRSINLKY